MSFKSSSSWCHVIFKRTKTHRHSLLLQKGAKNIYYLMTCVHLSPSMTQPLPNDSNLIRLPDVVSSFTGVKSESICVIAHAVTQRPPL